MQTTLTVAHYHATALTRARDDFQAAHPYPVLIRGRESPGSSTEAGAGGAAMPLIRFRTTVSRIPTERELKAARAPFNRLSDVGDLRVYVVRKRPDGVFAGRINIGRTATSDIQIDRSEVSKFHAYFTWDDTGVYYLQDAETTNGTWVDHEPLASGQRVRMADADVVHVGRCPLLFYYPAGFYDYLDSLQT